VRKGRLDVSAGFRHSRVWAARFRISEWIARSWLVIPSAYVTAALVLGEITPNVEPFGESTLGFTIGADDARAILSSISGGMIAFSGIVVSVAVLVVQFGAGQYTPRLVLRFRRDPAVKHALGLFVAPAIYALVCLRSIDPTGHAEVPNFSIGVALALLVFAVFAFFVLVGRMLDLLRPRRLFRRLAREGAIAIRDVYPYDLGVEPEIDVASLADVTSVIEHRGEPGIVSAIDLHRMMRVACDADVVVELLWPVGSFMAVGAPMFRIHGSAGAVDGAALDRAVIFTDERTITQDPAFAIRAIVDIAVRALSPAINDPTTAVESLDTLEALLHLLSHRDLGDRSFFDSAGAPRVLWPAPDWKQLLDLAVTEIRHYGIRAPQVTRRLRAVLDSLMQIAPRERHDAVRKQISMFDDGLAHAYESKSERTHAATPDHIGLGGFAQPRLKLGE
jgi:uncharacterized membrane protein